MIRFNIDFSQQTRLIKMIKTLLHFRLCFAYACVPFNDWEDYNLWNFYLNNYLL